MRELKNEYSLAVLQCQAPRRFEAGVEGMHPAGPYHLPANRAIGAVDISDLE